MNARTRIEALELATGPTMSEDEARALALQEMPFEELHREVKRILAEREPPAADDMSEFAMIERDVRKSIARRDAERSR